MLFCFFWISNIRIQSSTAKLILDNGRILNAKMIILSLSFCCKINYKIVFMIRPKYDKTLFPHWTTIPIRFRDLDPLNHVNNAIFNTYYEEARIEFIQEVNKLASELKNGFSFVLANIEIAFIRPVEYPNNIMIGSGIKSLGNSSITSFQAIYTGDEKKLASVAEAHGVWFNLNKQRPARIPDIPNTEQYILPDSLFE